MPQSPSIFIAPNFSALNILGQVVLESYNASFKLAFSKPIHVFILALIKFAFLKLAPSTSAPLKSAPINDDFSKQPDISFALINFAPFKLELSKNTVINEAPVKSESLKFVLDKKAPLKSVSFSEAPDKFSFSSNARCRLRPSKLALLIFQCLIEFLYLNGQHT